MSVTLRRTLRNFSRQRFLNTTPKNKSVVMGKEKHYKLNKSKNWSFCSKTPLTIVKTAMEWKIQHIQPTEESYLDYI